MANTPVKLGRRRVIRVDLETVQGTAEDPPTLEVLCYDAKIQPDDQMIAREPDGAAGGRIKSERGPATCTCTFRAELRSDGTDALDEGVGACLQACGLNLAASVYSPQTVVSSQQTVTIDVWRDGHYERCYGAMGNYTLSGEFGKQVFLEFTFQGLYSQLTDEAMASPSHSVQPPLRAAACTLTLGAYTPKISRFSITPNNPVEPREDVTAAEGVAHYIIGPGRNYVVEMDPEDPATETYDFRGLWLAKTEAALSLLLTDGTVNVTIAAPKLQQMPPQEGMRDSKATFDMQGQCNADSGDDELTITTAAVV